MSEEEYKKMWDNMLKKLNETEIYCLAIVNNQKNQEIDRLNNIINKLEIWVRLEKSKFNGAIDINKILDKLEELKDSDK